MCREGRRGLGSEVSSGSSVHPPFSLKLVLERKNKQIYIDRSNFINSGIRRLEETKLRIQEYTLTVCARELIHKFWNLSPVNPVVDVENGTGGDGDGGEERDEPFPITNVHAAGGLDASSDDENVVDRHQCHSQIPLVDLDSRFRKEHPLIPIRPLKRDPTEHATKLTN